MKVITKGKIPPATVYIGKCHHCQCVFECTKSDFFESVGKGSRWDVSDYKPTCVECPTCSEPIRTTNLTVKGESEKSPKDE